MTPGPRQRLRDFYDQALLSPELLCLNCARTTWNSASGRCSAQKRQDCELFVSHMITELAQTPALHSRWTRPEVNPTP